MPSRRLRILHRFKCIEREARDDNAKSRQRLRSNREDQSNGASPTSHINIKWKVSVLKQVHACTLSSCPDK